MKKELLVTLLRKDIAELAQMTDGFNELDFFPAALLNLAKDKADNIKRCLDELSELAKTKITAPTPTPVITESPVIAPEPAVIQEEIESVAETAEEPTKIDEIEINISHKDEIEVEETTETDILEDDCQDEEFVAEEIEYEEEEDDDDEIFQEEEEEEEVIEEIEEEEATIAETKKEPEVPQAITRNDQLQNQKVDDIKQAISIGDRFLFQRELFNNSGELLSKTITAINACRSFEDAQKYLNKKFKWDYENTTTERFMQIVARKFD